MRFHLVVSWPNASSPLLPDDGAGINVFADGLPIGPLKQARGERVFELPEGTAKVRLLAVFWLSLGPVGAEVLHIEQTYALQNGMLLPEPVAAFGGPHPLAIVKGLAGTSGAASIVLRTEFVDIGAFWKQFAAFFDYYEDKHKEATPDCQFLPLGYAGGTPLIWFANFSKSMLNSSRLDVSSSSSFDRQTTTRIRGSIRSTRWRACPGIYSRRSPVRATPLRRSDRAGSGHGRTQHPPLRLRKSIDGLVSSSRHDSSVALRRGFRRIDIGAVARFLRGNSPLSLGALGPPDTRDGRESDLQGRRQCSVRPTRAFSVQLWRGGRCGRAFRRT